ncbi:MAG: cytochrome d ubiquinol oxidase subunit II, partial [Anaerolineales bacterium]
LTMVSVFLLHGANFLTLRLEGELRDRARQAARKVYWAAAGTVVLLAVSTYIYTDLSTKIGVNPGIVPIAAVAVLLFSIYFINRRDEAWAFAFTALHIALVQVGFFTLMFPRLMVSSSNPAWSLTIYNASSSQYTLGVMSIVALIFLPIVLAYQAWTYYVFRRRITASRESLVY